MRARPFMSSPKFLPNASQNRARRKAFCKSTAARTTRTRHWCARLNGIYWCINGAWGPMRRRGINMNYRSDYDAKVMTAEEAVTCIPARGKLGMGMAASEPPALLSALETRLQHGTIEELRLYYMHSENPAHETVLKYEYMNVVKPYPFYMGPIERELVKLGLQENKKVVFYMPGNFSGVPEVMSAVGLDVFVFTVAPMDKA